MDITTGPLPLHGIVTHLKLSLSMIDVTSCLSSKFKKKMVAFLILASMAGKYLFLLHEVNRDPCTKRNRGFQVRTKASLRIQHNFSLHKSTSKISWKYIFNVRKNGWSGIRPFSHIVITLQPYTKCLVFHSQGNLSESVDQTLCTIYWKPTLSRAFVQSRALSRN